MKLTKKDIEDAGLKPELLTEVLALFDDVTVKEDELAKLRAKVPTDSQKIVESVDHEKFVAATAELEKLKTEIAAKLQREDIESGTGFSTIFSELFA